MRYKTDCIESICISAPFFRLSCAACIKMNVCFSWHCTFLLLWTSVPVRVLSSGDGGPTKDALMNILDIEPQLSLLRNRDLITSAQGVRPYTLLLNKENYHYGPKPKHRRPARLFRLLGSSFDPFWMAIERPAEADTRLSAGGLLDQTSPGNHTSSFTNSTTSSSFNIAGSTELTASAARYRQKLEEEAKQLDLGTLPSDAAALLRTWLVQSATCGLRYKWVDMGPVFWPRWVRHTDCDEAGSARTCSFPSGMVCRRAQVTYVKILAWHCWGREEHVGECARQAKGAGETGACFWRKCLWRQVPYPVVTACKCACK
ncbi:noggin-2-like [Brachyhypopomus gauderio]|uniref:noggin-2-like n=1 Tax=Brachyhypopomus gauderio TaxID=698409 RepID=UPI00404351C3